MCRCCNLVTPQECSLINWFTHNTSLSDYVELPKSGSPCSFSTFSRLLLERIWQCFIGCGESIEPLTSAGRTVVEEPFCSSFICCFLVANASSQQFSISNTRLDRFGHFNKLSIHSSVIISVKFGWWIVEFGTDNGSNSTVPFWISFSLFALLYGGGGGGVSFRFVEWFMIDFFRIHYQKKNPLLLLIQLLFDKIRAKLSMYVLWNSLADYLQNPLSRADPKAGPRADQPAEPTQVAIRLW